MDTEGHDGDGEGPTEEPAPRRRARAFLALGAVVVVGLGLGLGLGLSSGGPATAAGPEGVAIEQVPDLAPAGTTAAGAPVDGITCRTSAQEVVKYHIHVHLAIYVDGREERVPAGVGIPAPNFREHLAGGLFVDTSYNSCLYWLHVHSNDGVVHVESPTVHTFTLGQFFDIWRQPLGPAQVGPARGPVVAFENGRRFAGNPRDIPLLRHAVIQLDVGRPVVVFRPVHFAVTELCASDTKGCATSSR